MAVSSRSLVRSGMSAKTSSVDAIRRGHPSTALPQPALRARPGYALSAAGTASLRYPLFSSLFTKREEMSMDRRDVLVGGAVVVAAAALSSEATAAASDS